VLFTLKGFFRLFFLVFHSPQHYKSIDLSSMLKGGRAGAGWAGRVFSKKRSYSMFFQSFRTNRRLSELEEEVANLKREYARKDLDWSEMRARCKRLLDRTEKAAQTDATPLSPAVPGGDGISLTSIPTSSNRMSRIQQQLALRG